MIVYLSFKMFVNRYTFIFNKISSSLFVNLDFNLIKQTFFVLILLFVSIFFGIRIVSTLEEGYLIEKKLDLLKIQVKKLEEENILLQKEKDFIMSKDALELEYRNLGYAKIDEEIYFVKDSENNNSIKDKNLSSEEDRKINQRTRKEIWKEWLLLLFK